MMDEREVVDDMVVVVVDRESETVVDDSDWGGEDAIVDGRCD